MTRLHVLDDLRYYLSAPSCPSQALRTDLCRSFYQALGRHYGNDENWTFEPSVAEKVFQDWVAEHDIPVRRRQHLTRVDPDRTPGEPRAGLLFGFQDVPPTSAS